MLLALSACNKVETEIQPVSGEEGITITATLAPKGANTKAVADGGDKITVTWAVNEHIAILYTKDGNQVADATITAVDGSGAATISFTVVEGTADDTPCTLVYPLSAAKDDHSGVKDAATLLAAQDGTLNTNLDVRVGEGTIQTSTPGLTVTTQPEAQFAIFKFTTKNSDGSATIDVTSLKVTIGAQDYVITHAATSELFVALPAISGEAVSFTATGSDSKTYAASKASVTFAAGKYYQSTLKMKGLTTITWNSSNISDLYVSGTYSSYTKEGITLSANADTNEAEWKDYGDESTDGISFQANDSGGFTFTAPTGKKFTKIEMTLTDPDGWDWASLGTGWAKALWSNPPTVTWTGTAATTVGLLTGQTYWGGENVKSIVFTVY